MKTILVHVRHEAGPRFDALADRLKALADQTAPLVEAVTGLSLPDSVVIRTMTVRKWRAAHRRQDRVQLRGEARELRPAREARRRAKAAAVGSRMSRRVVWPSIGAQVVDFHQRPEVVVLPQALREAGRLDDERVLQKILAHEMTHLAQYAIGNELWALMNTRYPEQRGISDRDYSFALEGHAYWADREITTKILGAPVPTAEISPHATLRYRALAETPQRNEHLRYFNSAADSVGKIIEVRGFDAFNRLWTTPDLVPLTTETGRPELWLRRFQ
ncbi:hypothetical protein [Streptomyces sp. BE230]|uniref:hypothetical protein n=1 Tax=Streptomyces sp. BE230 TaxID=3002526 RepID=UPI002ED51BF2|nr:hypothetical protein [Streptomyces sp. BE230]